MFSRHSQDVFQQFLEFRDDFQAFLEFQDDSQEFLDFREVPQSFPERFSWNSKEFLEFRDVFQEFLELGNISRHSWSSQDVFRAFLELGNVCLAFPGCFPLNPGVQECFPGIPRIFFQGFLEFRDDFPFSRASTFPSWASTTSPT